MATMTRRTLAWARVGRRTFGLAGEPSLAVVFDDRGVEVWRGALPPDWPTLAPHERRALVRLLATRRALPR